MRTHRAVDRSRALPRRRVRRAARPAADADRRRACGASSSTRRRGSRTSWERVRAYLVEVLRLGRRRGASRPRSSRCSPASTRSSRSPTSSDLRRRPGEYDVVVVDCAPTAETIRLLSLPDVLAWYMDRLFPVSRRVNKLVGPIAVAGRRRCRSPATTCSAPLQRFYDRLDGVRDVLTDGEHERPPRREPRADGRRRSAPHLHLPLAVRLPRRRGDREPHAARRRDRPVVRRSGRSDAGAPRRHREPRSLPSRCSRALRRRELVGVDALDGFGASSTASRSVGEPARRLADAGVAADGTWVLAVELALRRRGSSR